MEIAILAVTKKHGGICIAGVDKALKWIRPVKDGGLSLADIHLNNGKYISISNVYNFSFVKEEPRDYQTENNVIDKNKPISYVKTLTQSQRKNLFLKLSENSLVTSSPNLDISQILKKGNRSLILLGPVTIESAYFYYGSYMRSPRVTCRVNSISIRGQNEVYDLPCTDIKFRAFAKSLLSHRKVNSLTLNEKELKTLLKVDKVFIAIGLTGIRHGDYWPMIVGIHTIPDYLQEITYNDI